MQTVCNEKHQSALGASYVQECSMCVDERDRAYGVPVDRASFSKASSLTLTLCTLLRCIALPFTLIRESIAAFAHCPSHVNCCGHALVRLPSIGKIVRSNSNCHTKTAYHFRSNRSTRLLVTVMHMLRQNMCA